MTVTQPDQTTLARKFKLDVNTGTPAAPVWTAVRGRKEFKPNVTPNLEDDSDYDSGGWGSQTKTQLEWTIEVKLARKVSPTSKTTYDTGQEALRTKSRLFGADGVAHIRYYDRDGGAEAYEGYAEVTWVPDGGDTKALELVTVTLTGKGALVEITNPDA